jgi:Flp pilus assembly protein TadD
MSRGDTAGRGRAPRKKPARSQPARPDRVADASSAESCCATGLEALRSGKLDEARACAARCKSVPGSRGAETCAAVLVALADEAGDLEAATAHLRRAAELAPGDAGIARRLSDVLGEGGDVKEAAAVLERVAGSKTTDADLLVDLGYARMMAGDRAGGRKAFERALALRPADSLIRRPLAQIYESLGDEALAAETLAAIPRESASPRVLGDLARLYLGSARYREAEEVCAALLASDPEHALLAQHGLTLCRIKRGDWRGALEVALTASRLDRFDLTTAFLAYAKDRLFTRIPDAERQESALSERFLAELKEHEDLHGEEGEVAGG